MKLEEVLPAMREGRVAVCNGERYRMQVGCIAKHSDGGYRWDGEKLKSNWTGCYEVPLDGWTLEPEPKVEWPKGSIQKALESKEPGVEARIVRRIWLNAVCGRAPLKMADININNISPLDLLALDWEVVP